jgi:hypothetical protein
MEPRLGRTFHSSASGRRRQSEPINPVQPDQALDHQPVQRAPLRPLRCTIPVPEDETEIRPRNADRLRREQLAVHDNRVARVRLRSMAKAGCVGNSVILMSGRILRWFLEFA